MPIYEYERADRSRFEIRQGFHDDALAACPDTGQPVRRIVSAAPVIFKGSGWYVTDSRPAAKSESTATSGPSSTATTSSSADSATSTGSEAKPTESKPTESKGSESGARKGSEAAA